MNSKRSKDTEVDAKTILNLLSDPVLITDQNGRLILINDAFGKATGLNLEEIIGKHFAELPVIDSKTKAFLMEKWAKTMQAAPSAPSDLPIIDGKTKAFLMEKWAKTMQAVPSAPYEVLFVTPAGEKHIVEVKASRILYDGEPANLVILRDVTRRKEDAKQLEEYAKRMEALVEEAEKRYYTLFNQAPIGIYLVDPETTKAVEFNDVACRQLGYSREEFAKLRVLDYEVIDSPEVVKMRIEDMKKAGGAIFETQHRRKNGEIIDVAVTARVIELAGKKFVHLTSQNITERKKAEEKLRDSEEKLRRIVDSSPDPVVVSSPDGTVLDCNPAALEKFGYSVKSEVLGRNVIEFFAEKERERALATLVRIGEAARNLEFTFQAKNGREFVGEIAVCAISQPSGDIASFVSTIRDTTERKEREKALRESEERFKQVAENAEEWIWEVDAHGTYTYSSPVVEKILGYKPEEIVGKKHFYDLFHPEERESIMNAALDVFKQKQPFHGFINRNVHKNGETIWLSTSGVPMLDQKGELAGYRGADTDITGFKKAEEALQASERNYRAVINGMNDTVWVIGFDGSFIDVNDAAVKVLGYSRKELLSGGINEIDKHLTRREVQALIDRLPTVGTQVFETVHTTKDGQGIPVEICSSLVTYQGKQAILSIARDITERKRMQRELAEYSMGLERLVEERTEQLKQTQRKLLKAEKLAAIGELAGMIGHDLRNPLTGIKGAAYYLKTKYAAEIDATGKDMLTTIENAISRSNKIINDLLEYSSKLSLEFTATTPKLLLKGALSFIEVPERIQIIDATKDKPKIKVDIGSMRKVFANIIRNAIDAVPVTGTLTITSYAAEGNVKFTFKDTGIGMTEETLSKLKLGFPLFTTKARGMGFGLPICKRIIEAHGGKISLKSTMGKGTTVTITIPVNPKPTDAGEEKWIFNESVLHELRASHKHREN